MIILLTAYIISIDHHSKGAIPTVESDNHVHRQRAWTGILFQGGSDGGGDSYGDYES